MFTIIMILIWIIAIWGIIAIIKNLGLKTCHDCRKNISKYASICPYCGHNFKSAQSQSYMLYCANCGKKNLDEDKACPFCGSYWKKKI